MEDKASRAVAAASRLVDSMERHRTLTLLMRSWRHVTEDSQKRRRENLFDAMGQQIQVAKLRCHALELLSERSFQVLEASQNPMLLQLVTSAWRRVCERPQQDSCASTRWPSDVSICHKQRRHSHNPVPVSPFSSNAVAGLSQGSGDCAQPRTLTGSMSVPHGGVADCCTQRSVSYQPELAHLSTSLIQGRSPRESSVDRACRLSTSAGYPDSTAYAGQRLHSSRSSRQILVPREVSIMEAPGTEAKKPLPRGPERFFYDTTSYTGCARFGGASVMDKENLVSGSRTKSSLTLPCNSPKLMHHQTTVVSAAAVEVVPPTCQTGAGQQTTAAAPVTRRRMTQPIMLR